MYASCQAWENCNFPQDELQATFYDDHNTFNTLNVRNNYANANASGVCAKEMPSQQYRSAAYENRRAAIYAMSPPARQFYRNASPTSEHCVNLNTDFYTTPTGHHINNNNHNNNNQYNENNNRSSPNLCEYTPAGITAIRHHPYQRESPKVVLAAAPLLYQSPPMQAEVQCQSLYQSSRAAPSYYAVTTHAPPQQQQQQPAQHRSIVPQFAAQPAKLNYGGLGICRGNSGLPYYSDGSAPAAAAPCQGNQPWTYAHCYGYAYQNQEPCQFTQFVDIEDFMNNEKRKEKSRDAARCRRSRETEIFTELAEALPMPKDDVNQLDKASIMRIAIAYLKVRDMLHLFPKCQEQIDADLKAEKEPDIDVDPAVEMQIADDEGNTGPPADLLKCVEASQLLKQTLDGFLLVLSNDGDVTYVSENLTEYLGIAKIDVMGQQIWEYSHQCDHAELKEALNIKRNGLASKVKDEHMLEDDLSTHHRDLFVRLKCTLTCRGRSINIKSASYKVIHLTGHLVVNSKGDRVLVAIGRPIPHPSNIEIPLGTTTFLTKHSLDMKFTYVDDKLLALLAYKPEDLLEKSLYDCHHGADSDSLLATFKTVLSKGQSETCRYRFLAKYGGYCWIVTQATMVYDKLKPQSVVCVNYVISNLENDNEIYSLAQYEASQQKLDEDNSTANDIKDKSIVESTKAITINKEQDGDEEADVCDNIVENLNAAPPLQPSAITTSRKSTNKQETVEVPLIQSPTTAAVRSAISPKPTTKFIINEENVDDDSDETICRDIKREESSSPPITIKTATRAITPIAIISPLARNLSPLRQSLVLNCAIGDNRKLPPKQKEEKRPKSVTASVFRVAAPGITYSQLLSNNVASTSCTASQDYNNLHSVSNNNINNNTKILINPNQLQTLNSATRAQSVTASVFTPISQLPNEEQEKLVKVSGTSRTALLQSQPPATPTTQQSQQQQQQDMNKAYLTFVEDDTTALTMLKEEPEDLVHLTTNAVDACMPLDETAPLFGEMLGLIGSYGSLLPDDINSLDSTASCHSPVAVSTHMSSLLEATANDAHNCNSNTYNNNGNDGYNSENSNNKRNVLSLLNVTGHDNRISNMATTVRTTTSAMAAKAPSGTVVNGINTNKNGSNISNINNSSNNSNSIDPFINYRDESNDTNCSQHLLSPSMASKSPEASSLPSLCSPNSLSQEDEFAFMTMSVDNDIDMTMRAPYIPMNEQDDLPLLTADDLMWCGSNDFTTDELNMHKDTETMQQLQLQHQQQMHTADNNRQNLLYGNGQLHQQQQHFSNSLCSSPASTVSSLSPSPVSHHHQRGHQQQQQQQQTQLSHESGSQHVFATDSSELAALLCGTGSGTLSILNGSSNGVGNGGNSCGSGLGSGSEENDCSNGIGSMADVATLSAEQQQQQLRIGGNTISFRLQQLQQQLQAQEQQQQQQQQELLGGLSNNCKKEDKYDGATAITAATLCDSMDDAFGYSKDSPNLDCWNELLQINVNDAGTSPVASPTCSTPNGSEQLQLDELHDCKPHLQQLQQNIVMNAVPLISIQSNKGIMLLQQPQAQQQQPPMQPAEKLIISQEMLLTQQHQQRSADSGKEQLGHKVATIKLLPSSGGTTTTAGGATICFIENKPRVASAKAKQSAPQQQHQIQQQHFGNKRHISTTSAAATTQLETKRLKGNLPNCRSPNPIVELQATPELLQQLMAPLQQKQQQQRKALASAPRWTTANTAADLKLKASTTATLQQQQQSNSVLKNLLISGCDVSAGYCIVPIQPKKLNKA